MNKKQLLPSGQLLHHWKWASHRADAGGLTDELVASDKAAELPFRAQVVLLLEHQDMLHRLGRPSRAGVKSVADVVGHAVRALEQQHHLVSVGAAGAVGGRHPGRILQ